MKIYMYITIMAIAQENKELANKIVSISNQKETKDGYPYFVIDDELLD